MSEFKIPEVFVEFWCRGFNKLEDNGNPLLEEMALDFMNSKEINEKQFDELLKCASEGFDGFMEFDMLLSTYNIKKRKFEVLKSVDR